MTESLTQLGDFERLLIALTDGDLSERQFAQLQHVLASDPAAETYYRQYMRLCALLEFEHASPDQERRNAEEEAVGSGQSAVGSESGIPNLVGAAEPVGAAVELPHQLDDSNPQSPIPNPSLPPIIIQPSPTIHYPLFTTHPFIGGMLFSYMTAAVIVGVGLLIGWWCKVSDEPQMAGWAGGHRPGTIDRWSALVDESHQSVPLPSPLSPLPPVVGRITGMVDCQWERKGLGVRDWGLEEGSGGRDQGSELPSPAGRGAGGEGNASPESLIPNPQSLVSLGDKFALTSGLMEIIYDTGAKVILQGPVTYEVESRSGGFLSVGKLTAKLEKKAEGGKRKAGDLFNRAPQGSVPSPEISNPQSPIPNPLFVVRTPTATVTDLGTEFGVEVDTGGRVDVHVFLGAVECGVPAADGVAAKTIHLTKDSAVRIAPAGAAVERRQADRSRFARMPKHRPIPLAAFYPLDGNADDQSGNGNHVGPSKMQDVTFVEGVEGQAAHFDADANSYIDLPIDARPEAMPKLTWGAWVRPRKIGLKGEILSTDIEGYGRTLTIDDRDWGTGLGTGVFRFATFLGEEGVDRGVFPSTGPLPQPNVWTFVAAVYDDAAHRVSLYVEDRHLRNGAGGLVEDRTIGSQFGACHPSIYIGRHVGDNVEPFDGEIDNVFVFRDVLGMRELELIRRHGATAILALAKGEELP